MTVFHSPIAIYPFSDASTKAYSAVVYVRKGSQISVALAKNQIAPIKTVTLPRLELLATQVAAQLSQLVIKAMNLATVIHQASQYTSPSSS